jgi:hypothetical protein
LSIRIQKERINPGRRLFKGSKENNNRESYGIGQVIDKRTEEDWTIDNAG